MASVELRGVRHSYQGREVVREIDLSLGTGTLGLLGPNGAGKTTLMRILATDLRPTGGVVEIAGREVDGDRTARRARRSIGYLPQKFPVVPSYTALDMVRYVAWLRSVPRSDEREASVQMLRRVGLEAKTGARMGTLSGGMVQRVGLACALVGDPTLVLLDEPTVGLDPAQRLEFREIVRTLSDRSVVLSTHLVEDVRAVADEVVVLQHGRATFRGSVDELEHRARDDAPGDTRLERGYMSVLAQVPAC